MNDSEGVRALRRELGRALKAARGAAGYSQAQLARRTGYARSTVSTVESGSQNVPRIFWERSDAALGTGTALLGRYDRLAQRQAAGCPRPAAGTRPYQEARQAGRGLESGIVAEALAAYRELGWRAEHASDRVELVCGKGVEALEVPRPAGVVAIRWWLHTGGVPDEIRGLPALPGPQDALAVITTGDRLLFLVQSGACPWAGPISRSRPLPRASPGWWCAGTPTAAGSRPRRRGMTGGGWCGRPRRRAASGSLTPSSCSICWPKPPR